MVIDNGEMAVFGEPRADRDLSKHTVIAYRLRDREKHPEVRGTVYR